MSARLSEEEWKIRVALAEKLAQENGGILPGRKRLIRMGRSGLVTLMRKYPEKFSHLKKEIKQVNNIEQNIALAEKLTQENGGILPTHGELEKTANSGLSAAIKRYPEKFSHLKRQNNNIEQNIALAEKLAQENGGILQRPCQLITTGYSALQATITRYPEKFSHLKRHPDFIKRKRLAIPPIIDASEISTPLGTIRPKYDFLLQVDGSVTTPA